MEQKQLYGCVLRFKDNAFTEPDGLRWALKERERETERRVFLVSRIKGKRERGVKGSPKEIPAGSNTAACKESICVCV